MSHPVMVVSPNSEEDFPMYAAGSSPASSSAQAFSVGKSLSMLLPTFSDLGPAMAPKGTGAGIAAGGIPREVDS